MNYSLIISLRLLAPWLATPAVTAVLVALSVDVASAGLDRAVVEGGVAVAGVVVSCVAGSRVVVVTVPVSTIVVELVTGGGSSVATAVE